MILPGVGAFYCYAGIGKARAGVSYSAGCGDGKPLGHLFRHAAPAESGLENGQSSGLGLISGVLPSIPDQVGSCLYSWAGMTYRSSSRLL